MSSEIFFQDATRLAELIRKREISPVEVMQAHLDRIEAIDPKVNAVVTVADDAMKAAKAAEAAVLAGGNRAASRCALHCKRLDRHSRCADAAWFAHFQRTRA
jgi:Asp-tRNA(Asn)/Glu-tRNA(Gln) amidotransferase A subunit family amidase